MKFPHICFHLPGITCRQHRLETEVLCIYTATAVITGILRPAAEHCSYTIASTRTTGPVFAAHARYAHTSGHYPTLATTNTLVDPHLPGSVLDQSIDNLPNTKDSFFALTQNPFRREPLSPMKFRRRMSSRERDPVRLELIGGQDKGKPAGGNKKKRKSIVSLSWFAST